MNFEDRAESQPLPLTDKAIKAFIKATGGNRTERPIDGHKGLRIRIRNHRAVWVYRFKLGDTLRSMVLGDAKLSIKDVLTKYDAAVTNRAEGIDPLELKSAERDKAEAAAAQRKVATAVEALTVRALIHAHLDDAKIGKLRTYDQRRRRLESHCAPLIGLLPAAKVTRDNVLDFTDRCDKTTGEAERNARVRDLRAVWTWAMNTKKYADKLPFNPWRDVKPNPAVTRDRVLTEAELKKLLAWLPTCAEPVQGVLRLCLLTSVRSGNAADCRIEEIAGNRWTIPGVKYKTGESHTVILSKQAMALIEAHRDGRTAGWLFPSTMKASAAISGDRVRVVLKECAIPNIRPHDFRRTIRTWAAERGVSHDVGERLLGHSKGGVAGIYNRAQHNIPAGEVWQQWADYLDSLNPSDNVVAIHPKVRQQKAS